MLLDVMDVMDVISHYLHGRKKNSSKQLIFESLQSGMVDICVLLLDVVDMMDVVPRLKSRLKKVEKLFFSRKR